MPNSPKETFVPPVALARATRVVLLAVLDLTGISIMPMLPFCDGRLVAGRATTVATTVVTTAGCLRRVGLLASRLLVGEVALVESRPSPMRPKVVLAS